MNSEITAAIVLGILFLAAVGYFIYKRRVDKEVEVFEYGQVIQARVVEIEERMVDAPEPDKPLVHHQTLRYFIQAEGVDPRTNQTRTFTSHPLLGVPEHIKVGGMVKVRIDTHDPNEYLVDIAL